MHTENDACDRERVMSRDEIMTERAQAQVRLESDRAEQQILHDAIAMGTNALPPCHLCGESFDTTEEAVVAKLSLHTASMIVHADCLAQQQANALKAQLRKHEAADVAERLRTPARLFA